MEFGDIQWSTVAIATMSAFLAAWLRGRQERDHQWRAHMIVAADEMLTSIKAALDRLALYLDNVDRPPSAISNDSLTSLKCEIRGCRESLLASAARIDLLYGTNSDLEFMLREDVDLVLGCVETHIDDMVFAKDASVRDTGFAWLQVDRRDLEKHYVRAARIAMRSIRRPLVVRLGRPARKLRHLWQELRRRGQRRALNDQLSALDDF